MQASASRPHFLPLLLGVVLLAAGLRFYRLSWGLPDEFYPDEATLFRRALDVAATGELHTGFVSYPPLVIYLLAAIYRAAATWSGVAVTALERSDVVLLGRMAMAVLSVATVGGVAVLGLTVYGAAAGIVAGLAMAVVPLHVMQSHIISTDVPLTLLVVLSLWLAVQAAGSSVPGRWLQGSGFVSGLAAGAKYPGGIVIVATAWRCLSGLVAAARRGDSRGATGWIAVGLGAVALSAVAFSLAFPDWIADLPALQRRFAWENLASRSAGLNPFARLGPEGIRSVRGAYQLLILFPASLTPLLYVIGLLGIVRMAIRPSAREATLLAFALAYFIFFATARTVFARYYLPLVPVFAVAVGGMATSIGRRGATSRIVMTAALVIAIGYSALLSFSITRHTGLAPQRELRARLQEMLRHGHGGDRPTVARPPEPYGDYTGLAMALRGLPLRSERLYLDRTWLEEQRSELLIIPELHVVHIFRNEPESEAARTLRALAEGELPYRLVTQVKSSYLHRELYGWLDPYFLVIPERRGMGFQVYRLDVDTPTTRAAPR
jgi:4-amino-4-deoxy-L-arabinose transferase-like glycosyltransferase